MQEPLVLALAAALVAGLFTNALIVPVARLSALASRLERMDGRRRDAGSVPRLGGLAIGLGVAAGCALSLARWHEWGSAIPRSELMALGIATSLVFAVGLIDDLVGVSPAKKFLVELLAAWLLVRVGWTFEVIRIPAFGEFDLGILGGLVSLVWIVGVTNAINLIDGLDGLASGIVAIVAASLLAYSVLLENPGSVVLMAAILGACLGFLRHNWEPARVFMGDSGSLTLGFLLAAISVHSSVKAQAAVAILVPILALGLPVIDTLLVMAVRFLERKDLHLAARVARVFRADRLHLHYLLEHLGARRRRIVILLYCLALLFCAGALFVATTGQAALGGVLLILEFSVVLLVRWLGMVAIARRIAVEQRAEARSELEERKFDLLESRPVRILAGRNGPLGSEALGRSGPEA